MLLVFLTVRYLIDRLICKCVFNKGRQLLVLLTSAIRGKEFFVGLLLYVLILKEIGKGRLLVPVLLL
jgi:hypothetical protein